MADSHFARYVLLRLVRKTAGLIKHVGDAVLAVHLLGGFRNFHGFLRVSGENVDGGSVVVTVEEALVPSRHDPHREEVFGNLFGHRSPQKPLSLK